jgi:erythromycin esterase-like protein
MLSADRSLAGKLAADARPVEDLLDLVGDARLVLIGEASHGTHEHYATRAALTRRLISDHGFTAVAIEADFPDSDRVTRWVRGEGDDPDAATALSGFTRFPQWMWRNTVMRDFVTWLRGFNQARGTRVGVVGIDLYSLHSSAAEVIRYLEEHQPDRAAQARELYRCFDESGGDAQLYGQLALAGLASCEKEVVAQLVGLLRRRADLAPADPDAYFSAEMNARLVRGAEVYYRSMFQGRISSWNVRDRHMFEALEALLAHLGRQGPAKVVVWAHNSHLGDARFTEMGHAGELNLGQLVRERYGDQALLVGQTTHHGTVAAADDWGGAVERMAVRPALDGSYEALLHQTGVPRFFLDLRGLPDLQDARLERAIGVIYRPQTERMSHYFHASLPRQFDALLHHDVTRAVEPLELEGVWPRDELPETYPEAL